MTEEDCELHLSWQRNKSAQQLIEKEHMANSDIKPAVESKQNSRPQQKSGDKEVISSELSYDPFILEKVFPNTKDLLVRVGLNIEELVKDCLYVFDANILLFPFVVGKDSLDNIAEVFEKLVSEDRLFLPDQAIREYARHKSSKIAEAYSHIHNLKSNLPELHDIKTPMFEGTPEYDELVKAIKELKASKRKYSEQLQKFQTLVRNWNNDDPVSLLYSKIFSEAQIISHSKSHTEIESDVRYRNEHSLPPGYKDKSKLDGGIGDVIIWHSILELAQKRHKNVVLVTNDVKPDWMVRTNNEALFPRFELIDEFYRVTGQNFNIFQFDRFLKIRGAETNTVCEVISKNVTEQAQIKVQVAHFGTREHIANSQNIQNLFYLICAAVSEFVKHRESGLIDEWLDDDFIDFSKQFCELLDVRDNEIPLSIWNKLLAVKQILKSMISLSWTISFQFHRMKESTDTEEQKLLFFAHRLLMEAEEIDW